MMVCIPRGVPHKFKNTSQTELLKFTWTLSPSLVVDQFVAKA